MMALLSEFGPWLLAAGGALLAFVFNLKRKTDKAEADRAVAQVKKEAADANVAVTQKAAAAAKERTDVENDIAARPAGDSANRLRNDGWTRD